MRVYWGCRWVWRGRDSAVFLGAHRSARFGSTDGSYRCCYLLCFVAFVIIVFVAGTIYLPYNYNPFLPNSAPKILTISILCPPINLIIYRMISPTNPNHTLGYTLFLASFRHLSHAIFSPFLISPNSISLYIDQHRLHITLTTCLYSSLHCGQLWFFWFHVSRQ